MSLSTGLAIFLCSPGLFFCSKKHVKNYPVLLLILAIIYHLTVDYSQPLSISFIGHRLELYRYNEAGQLFTYAFLVFGLAALLFLRSKEKKPLYYFFALWQIGASIGILFSGDFLSFFIFWELIALSSVILLWLDHSLPQAKKYFITHFFGAITLLIGIGINYRATGTMNLQVVAGLPFFITAAFIKGAVFPFQFWVTGIYSTIKPETAVFLSAYTTKVGIFSLTLLAPNLDLQVIGGLVALVFVLYALKQNTLRRLLAFHLISQMGYVLAAWGVHTPKGDVAGLYHLINNIFFKGLLFMIAASLIKILGTEDLLKIRGRGKKYPFLFLLTVIAALSISGIPPFNGFISKSLILKSVENPLAHLLLVIAGIGTAISFTKVLFYGFIQREENDGTVEVAKRTIAISQCTAMGLLAMLCLLLGLFPKLILGHTKINFFSLDQIIQKIWPAVVGVVIFISCYRFIITVIEKITPDSLNLGDFFETNMTRLLDRLQKIVSGNLQHYLIWIVTALVFLWAYIFSMV